MRRLGVLWGLALVGLCSTTAAYEWRSHNSMALHARELARKAETDLELRSFLDAYGQDDLDTRAGTPYDPHGLFGIDEDYTEGGVLPVSGFCYYREYGCYPLCSVDHFHPPLEIPLAGRDASDHARDYFDWAVALYKAGICHPSLKALYHRWAARALGHAIHLVHDMGSPQHTGPENHAPIWTRGVGDSFHERWTLEFW